MQQSVFITMYSRWRMNKDNVIYIFDSVINSYCKEESVMRKARKMFFMVLGHEFVELDENIPHIKEILHIDE